MNELLEAVQLIGQPNCPIFVADIGPLDFGLHFGEYNAVQNDVVDDEIDDDDRPNWNQWNEYVWINLSASTIARLKMLGVELNGKYGSFYFSRETLWDRTHSK